MNEFGYVIIGSGPAGLALAEARTTDSALVAS